MQSKQVKGFTLIELLIVIGIIAILATVVILTLNPAELLRQARDSNRITDLSNLQSAIAFYLADVSLPLGTDGQGMGDSANCYISVVTSTSPLNGATYPGCAGRFSGNTPLVAPTSTDNQRLVDGTGWVPINFKNITGGASPISVLPIDPNQPNVFTADTWGGSFYAYKVQTSTLSFEINAHLESTKFASSSENDGGNSDILYEVGTFPGLAL